MVIRPYTEADLPSLRALFLASRRHSWTWLDDSDWRLEDFDRVTRGETILVAEEAGQCVGFAALLECENFLHSLFVDPDWQGSGAGSALLQAVQRTFTATGALKCLAENLQAQSFYKKHGWRVVAQGEGDEGDYLLMHYALQTR